MGIYILAAMLKNLTFEGMTELLASLEEVTIDQVERLLDRINIILGTLINTVSKDMTPRKWRRVVALFALRATLICRGSVNKLAQSFRLSTGSFEEESWDTEMQFPVEVRLLRDRLRDLAQSMGSLLETQEYMESLYDSGPSRSEKKPLYSSNLSWRRLVTLHISVLMDMLTENARRKMIWSRWPRMSKYQQDFPHLNWGKPGREGLVPTGVPTIELAELIGLRMAMGLTHEGRYEADAWGLEFNTRRLHAIEMKRVGRDVEDEGDNASSYDGAGIDTLVLHGTEAHSETVVVDGPKGRKVKTTKVREALGCGTMYDSYLLRPTGDLYFYIAGRFATKKGISGPHWVDKRGRRLTQIDEETSTLNNLVIEDNQVQPGWGTRWSYHQWLANVASYIEERRLLAKNLGEEFDEDSVRAEAEAELDAPELGEPSASFNGPIKPNTSSPFWAAVYHIVLSGEYLRMIPRKYKTDVITQETYEKYDWARDKVARAERSHTLLTTWNKRSNQVRYTIFGDIGVEVDIPIVAIRRFLYMANVPAKAYALRCSMRGAYARHCWTELSI